MEGMYALFAQHSALTVNSSDTMMTEVLDVLHGAGGGQEGQDGMAFVAGSLGRGATGSPAQGRGGHTPHTDCTLSILDNGNLNKVAVKHNQVTYHLAPRPPISGECELKARVHKDTVTTVRGGSESDYGIKGQFLAQYFQFLVVEGIITRTYATSVLALVGSCFCGISTAV